MENTIDILFLSQFVCQIMETIKDARQALSEDEYKEFIESSKRLIAEMGEKQLVR